MECSAPPKSTTKFWSFAGSVKRRRPASFCVNTFCMRVSHSNKSCSKTARPASPCKTRRSRNSYFRFSQGDAMNFRTLVATATLAVSATFLVSCTSQKSEPTATALDNAKQLRALFDEEWEYELKQSPETAT